VAVLFVTVSVYVMFEPVATGLGAAVSVTDRSAACTVTFDVAVLFPGTGSVPVSLTVTEFVIVDPIESPEFTATTTLKLTEAEAAKVPVAVQTMEPVPPTAGCVPHVQPAGGVTD
jgi:hypothetical protein